MPDQQHIAAEIELVTTLKMLAESYEEIAVMKMQKVRGSVLKTREFLQNIGEVYSEVRASHKKQIDDLRQKMNQKGLWERVPIPFRKKQSDTKPIFFTTRQTNGKTVSIFVSSTAKLYGDIISRVFHKFVKDMTESDSDIVIVGAYGKELYEASSLKKPFQFFDLPDSGANADNMQPIFEYILQYENVKVYYGQFVNLVNQTPTVADVFGQPISSAFQAPAPKDATAVEANQMVSVTASSIIQGKVKFLFEPSLFDVLKFFETQILYSLFSQTVHEGELSRLASRINAMEAALGNIDTRSKQLGRESVKARRFLMNKKQQSGLVGILVLFSG